MHFREPQSEYSHRVDYAESRPSRVRSLNHQSKHHLDRYDNLDEDDEMPFSNHIISVKLLKGIKPPTDMEPYDGSTDLQ